uniref:Serpin domain-containing protein n=1 Tax=Panagrolaimus sp. ES5 TaxID=591445 RepID=A0AC34F287_9BILA
MDFSLKILKAIKSEESIVYSPFSILNNLAIIYAGSDGKTADQLSQFLGKSKDDTIQYYYDLIKYIKNINDDNVQLLSSDCLFVSSEPILPSFKEIMVKFDVKLKCLNFKEAPNSAKEINQFISQNTHGRIQNIVADIDITEDANLFVVNALYFSGQWETPFNEMKSTFREKEEAQMLYRTVRDEGWNLVESETWQCLGIPFKNRKFWLHILLPKKEYNLSDLIPIVDEKLLMQCVSKKEVTKVEVFFPKFLLETKIPLDAILKKAGLTEIFEFGSIRKIFADPHNIDTAIHFTKFEINKHGAEAASASVIRVVPVCAYVESDMKYFYATDPFIYFITLTEDGPSDVKTVLLMGQYWGPNSTKYI